MGQTLQGQDDTTIAVKEVDANIWTVDGSTVSYTVGPFSVPCPTRMTLIRDGAGRVLVHSGIRPSSALFRAVWSLGTVSAVLIPNSFHHLFANAWLDAFPQARVYSASRMPKHAQLSRREPHPVSALLSDWGETLDAEEVDAGAWSEIALFHRPSKSLVLTDLMQNFQTDGLNTITRVLLRVGRAASASPTASVEMRAPVFLKGRRRAVRESFGTIQAWGAERILIAHGPQPEGDPSALLAKAFSWV